MGDVWCIEHGPDRGIWFEEQYDLDKFLDAVPKEAAAHSKDNPRLAGIMIQLSGLSVRLATLEQMARFRSAALRSAQQRQILHYGEDFRRAGLPAALAALLLEPPPKRAR